MSKQVTQISTINPATENQIETYQVMSKLEIENISKKAKNAFSEWRYDYEKRRGFVYNLVEYLKKNKEKLGKIATNEMGKVLKESISEIEKCTWALEYYADNGANFLSDEVLNTAKVHRYFRTFIVFAACATNMITDSGTNKKVNLT